METNTTAKNLLLNHTCDTCTHVSNYGCLLNYGANADSIGGWGQKPIPTENTCKSWKQAAEWMLEGWQLVAQRFK